MTMRPIARLMLTGTLFAGLVFSLSACNSLPNPFAKAPESTESSGSAESPAASAEDIKALFEAGVNASKSGQWETAIQQYQQVIDKDPNYASTYANLGWAYAETGQFDKAVPPLHKALSLEPDNAGARANLAWAYAGQKQWTLAVQEAEKATTLDTGNPYAFATLGWALLETGQHDRAITAYQKATALKPDLDSAHLALGSLFCGKKQPEQANEHLQHLRQMGSPKASELLQVLNQGCK